MSDNLEHAPQVEGSEFSYRLVTQTGAARRGVFVTPHGAVPTPAFMPVGTQGTVKGLDIGRLEDCQPGMVLVNTYHLWVRPGPEVVRDLGGIHTFSGWSGPILSDSGGYQVFSLEGLRKVTEEGVAFRSSVDGRKLFLTPELAVNIQDTLGVDVAMAFDECPAADLDKDAIACSLARTHRWAQRCIATPRRSSLALFGITQGGRFADLRGESAAFIGSLPFTGIAIGGVSVGEPRDIMYEILSYHVEQLPQTKIRYLMGVGTPGDILYAVSKGIDLFDCVMPTRSGRFGRAFLSRTASQEPFINIRNAKFMRDKSPLDAGCSCLTCQRYSRGYLHHLFRCGEMLGPQAISLHNTFFYQKFMRHIRDALDGGHFAQLFAQEFPRWRDVGAHDGNSKAASSIGEEES